MNKTALVAGLPGLELSLRMRLNKDCTAFTMQPIGINTIRNLYKSAFHAMGISNWKSLKPHALRAHFITKLANDDSVNIQETMAAALDIVLSLPVPLIKTFFY